MSTHLLTRAGALGSGSPGPLWHGTVSSGMCLLSAVQPIQLLHISVGKPNPLKGCVTDRTGCANASVLENCSIMSWSSHSALQVFGLIATACSHSTTPSLTPKQ